MKIDKLCFVTGGDKGIGRAIVENLSLTFRHVVFTYNQNIIAAEILTKEFKNTTYFQCDLRNRERTLVVLDEVFQKGWQTGSMDH